MNGHEDEKRGVGVLQPSHGPPDNDLPVTDEFITDAVDSDPVHTHPDDKTNVGSGSLEGIESISEVGARSTHSSNSLLTYEALQSAMDEQLRSKEALTQLDMEEELAELEAAKIRRKCARERLKLKQDNDALKVEALSRALSDAGSTRSRSHAGLPKRAEASSKATDGAQHIADEPLPIAADPPRGSIYRRHLRQAKQLLGLLLNCQMSLACPHLRWFLPTFMRTLISLPPRRG